MNGALDFSKGKLAEWVFRLLVLASVLWVSLNFVQQKDYKLDSERRAVQEEKRNDLLNRINETLARMDERSKNDDTKTRLAKVEEKVHEIEKKMP